MGINPELRKYSRCLAFGLLGLIMFSTGEAGPAAGEISTAAGGDGPFRITYGGDRTLGVFLGYDGDQNSPIGLGTPQTVDVNGDGLDDVVFSANARANDQINRLPARIFVSTGKTMRDKTSSRFPSSAKTQLTRDLLVGDFNGDGRPDMFFSNHGTESVWPFPGEQNRLLLSSGRSSHVDATRDNIPIRPDFSHGADSGDLDGDGDLDLFVPNLGSVENHPSTLLRNDGTGVFEIAASWGAPNGILPADYTSWPDPFWSQICDMDGDGDLDIYVSSENGPRPERIRYLVNDGSGGFSFSATTIRNFPAKKGWPQDSDCTDIDRDGDDDVILFNNTESGGDFIQILINNGDGTLADESNRVANQQAGKRMPATAGAPQMTVIDLDGDGDDDFLVQRWNDDFSSELGYAFINDGTGNFARLAKSELPNISSNYHALDINGDGITDFLSDDTWKAAWNQDRTNQFRILFGQLSVSVRRGGWPTDDEIAGGSRGDVLLGRGGADTLRGNGGNDVLKGGPGHDVLIGGPGKDTLTGHGGRNRFRLLALDDSRVCPGCDTIRRFRAGRDKVDLARIDAKRGVGGNQKFSFIGRKRFSGAKGELRYYYPSAGTTRVAGDVDGDRKADFEIRFNTELSLTKDNFIL